MKHIVLALAAVQLLLCAAQALASVSSTDIAPVSTGDQDSTPLLEKTWTVSTAALDKLEIQVAGNVFVDYDASLQGGDSEDVAQVVMRASAPQLLDAVDVSVIGGDDDRFGVDSGVRVHYKNQYTHVKGLVVTHILLSKPSALRAVSASVAQNVVLGDDVVVQQNQEARLHFSSHGDGHIFVGSPGSGNFDVRSLGIAISGDGAVQFQASSLRVAEETVVSLVGAGHAAVLVDEEMSASKVESAIAGKGSVFFQTPSLQTTTLSTEIVGDGEATYASGTCVDEKIHLAGDGAVNAGSIVCQTAAVSILGIGEAVVQATDRLSTMLLLTGSVKYVHERPRSIQSSGIVLGSSIKPAEAIPVKEFTPVSPPSREASGVFLTVEKANNDDSPYVHARPVIETAMRLQTLSASLPESLSAFVLFEVAVVGMALTAFSAFKFQQRRIRNKYQQLLP